MLKKRKILFIFLVIMFLIIPAKVFAVEENFLDSIYYKAGPEDSNTEMKVKLSNIENEYYLFLPASADITNLNIVNNSDIEISLAKDGKYFNMDNTSLLNILDYYTEKPLDGIYSFDFIVNEKGIGIKYRLNIMKSENIDSMFIVSEDLAKDREYIEADPTHNAKASGDIALLKSDNTLIYDDELKEIKGRGNSTWQKAKKPYQIKFDKKQDLLENGEKSKKWILLANYVDTSLIHNEISYNLSKEIGLDSSPDCKAIDLYYDGEYRGNYLLSEKVEIGDGRLEIEDLEKAFEEANLDIDMDDLPLAKASTENGALYQYVDNLKNPENISGGYLIELDNAYYSGEKSWIKTASNNYFVVKSPEYASKDAMNYIGEFIQEIDDCIRNNGINPKTGKTLEEYIDIESFVKYIIVQEFIKNWDAFASSTFFYKPENEDKLYAGPIWDCDGSFGIRCDLDGYTSPEGFMARGWNEYLLEIPVIKEELKNYFNNSFEPIINNILFGNQEGKYLKSIDAYVNNINASQKMNYKLWDIYSEALIIDFNSFEESIEYLKNFAVDRAKWLKDEINSDEYIKDDVEDTEEVSNLIICEPVFFDAEYYESLYADLKDIFGNNYRALYEHYMSCGRYEGRQASRVFNPEFYLNYYSDLKQAFQGPDRYIKALEHFVSSGVREGRRGSASFSPTYYRQSYKDLENAFGDNLIQYYIHYAMYGFKENRVAMSNIIITNEYFFDANWYLKKYEDLKKAFGNNYEAAYSHYLNSGIREGRSGSAVFDPVEYLNNYEDLDRAFIGENRYSEAIKHFWNFGIKEGRIGSKDFNINIYRENNNDLKNAFNSDLLAYYVHYINLGINENRICK